MMNKLLLAHMLVVIFYTAVSEKVNAQPNIGAIAELLDQHAEQKGFQGMVLIADQGRVVLEKPIGYANLQAESAIQTNTKFSIASITKLFTAIVVLQLVQEEKVALAAPVVRYLPGVPIVKSDKITVEDLLLHTSGLPKENENVYQKARTPLEMITLVAGDKKTAGKPGTYLYSNINYIILGLLIEQVTGSSWKDQVEIRILNPLKMRQTGFLQQGAYPTDMATGYLMNDKGEKEPAVPFPIENFYSAGSMYSTARDLLLLDQALYKEVLLREEARQMLMQGFPGLGYASYGARVFRYPFLPFNPTIHEARGTLMGFTGTLMRFTDDRYTVILLSNTDGLNLYTYGDRDNLREQIILLMGKQ